ncbi:VapE domain-containing protein [Nitrobacter sp.]|uniref:VapE domain-containing protein n=1 Tax=Nitrobacter sp. TaxID=29420 RepID=UPI00262E89EB|nr:VapE domain-containing protein [Nitrobacter sp.]
MGQSVRGEFDQLDRWLGEELVELDDEDAIGALYLEYNEKVRLLQMRQDALVPQHNKVSTIVREAGGRLNTDPIPLTGTQRTVAELGQPVLDEFLTASTSVDASPSVDYPRLPETLNDHVLFEQMNDAIERILAMAEGSPELFRQDRVLRCLAVLYAVHPDICERVVNRIISSGAMLSSGKFDSAVKAFENKVRREINTSAGFILDSRGNPDPANSDNVAVFLRTAGKQLRHNAWFQRNEIADADKENWRHLDDDGRDDLLVDAENSQFNYHPTKERFHRALNRIAREDIYDPVLERIDECARAWDGVPRLDHWLHHVCGVPDDEYHAAVSRNIVGGMIRRARHPGCKHDECPILISKQGTAKSTIAEVLSLDPDWFTDSIEIGGRKVDIIPEMRGKWVIELQELSGMAKTEVEKVKAFISTKKDNARLSYRTEASEPPRRCIFIGTSNDRRPLRDASGGRRFLPVYLSGHADIDWLRANVEHIIGECATREAAGETFGIPKHLWSVAAEHQEAARQMSPLEEHVADLIGPFRTAACKVASADILEALRFRKCNDNKIGSAMERLSFTQPNRHDRIWVSKSATGNVKGATPLRLQRTLHEMTFRFDGLPPPPY